MNQHFRSGWPQLGLQSKVEKPQAFDLCLILGSASY